MGNADIPAPHPFHLTTRLFFCFFLFFYKEQLMFLALLIALPVISKKFAINGGKLENILLDLGIDDLLTGDAR